MSKDLSEFYTEAEISEIKADAKFMVETSGNADDYDGYIEYMYDKGKEAEDHRLASLAGELRGLPGCEY